MRSDFWRKQIVTIIGLLVLFIVHIIYSNEENFVEGFGFNLCGTLEKS